MSETPELIEARQSVIACGSNEMLLILALRDFIRTAIADRLAPVQNNRAGEELKFSQFLVLDGWPMPPQAQRTQGVPAEAEKPTIYVMPALGETKEHNEMTVQVEARAHLWSSDGYMYPFGALMAIRDALLASPIIDDRYIYDPSKTKWAMFDDMPLPVWAGALHVKFTIPTVQQSQIVGY